MEPAGRRSGVYHHRLAVRKDDQRAVSGLAVIFFDRKIWCDYVHRTVAAGAYDVAYACGHFIIAARVVAEGKMRAENGCVAVRRSSHTHAALPFDSSARISDLAHALTFYERLEIHRTKA